MVSRLVPAHLKKALDLLEADPARAWTVGEIASACGTGRRTLQRQFRDFVGQMPMEQGMIARLGHERDESKAEKTGCLAEVESMDAALPNAREATARAATPTSRRQKRSSLKSPRNSHVMG
jgi:AraC-like DNA-binding protein